MFISFEGGEGSGKTTQARLLAERIEKAGQRVLLVHEPGSTPLGWQLRQWLKQHSGITPGAELFLFAAARAELVAKEIKPALKRKLIVVADRYADSTTAYQGYGRKLSLQLVDALNALATQGIGPDLTVLLDIAPEEALQRLGPSQVPLGLGEKAPPATRRDDESQRRFERESLDFHQRVRDGYLQLARQEPLRWLVLDATKPVEKLAELVWERVDPMLSNSRDKDLPGPLWDSTPGEQMRRVPS